MSVDSLVADIYKYSGRKDFQVSSTFVDERHFKVDVRRLDTASDGWTENLKVLCWFKKEDKTIVVTVGPSSAADKSVDCEVDFEIKRGEAVSLFDRYDPLPSFQPQRISRQAFNRLFNTSIVHLPKTLFAVGVKNGCVYMYNDTYKHLYMIELSIKHLVGVGLQSAEFRQFYFIICAYDGYLESNYLAPRTRSHKVGEEELAGQNNFPLPSPDVYPVFHPDEYILAQSHLLTTPNAINVPDRYYFYLNRYNEYRSVHNGMAFRSKKPQIVYGSLPRGGKFNFTKRRDIDISPRQYFYSDAVPKDNIVAPQWIERSDMIGYKYILDIDGNSSTWDATAWKLNSGSVILKADSCWKQWFYDEYKPWENFVPVADDFSDLQEKFRWCEEHPEECEKMIERNMALFQKVYRFNSVMDYTKNILRKLNRLEPAYVDEQGRSLYIFTFDELKPLPFKVNKIPNYTNDNLRKAVTMEALCKRMKESDLLMFANLSLLDVNGWNPSAFLERYDKLESKIVFGAERNLWPESLDIYRFKIEQLNKPNTHFRYLNSGFFVAQAGELLRLLEERVYENNNFIDQEYLTLAYISGRYSMTLDYKNHLVINTFQCPRDEIDKNRREGVPFIHWNGGRF